MHYMYHDVILLFAGGCMMYLLSNYQQTVVLHFIKKEN